MLGPTGHSIPCQVALSRLCPILSTLLSVQIKSQPPNSCPSHLVSICGCCLASLQRAAASSSASHSLLSASPPSSPNSSEPDPPPPSAEVEAPPGVPGASWWSAAATDAPGPETSKVCLRSQDSANCCAFAAKESTLVNYEPQITDAAHP
jgi:hypothetical protein